MLVPGWLEDDLSLLPEGEYRLGYIDYRTCIAFNVPRVVVRFKILDFGEHFGKQLERWYRVGSLRGKPRKFGDFRVGKRSDFFRDYLRVIGAPTANRRDRLSFTSLKNKVVVGSIRTVVEGRDQEKLETGARYSVVNRLLRTEE